MLDLDTWIDLNKVVPAHLVDQKLRGPSISVPNALRKLDGVIQDGLPNLLGQMSSGGNLNDLLVPPLDGAIAFKQVNGVPQGVRKDLDLDVTGAFEESFDEDGPIAER